MDTPKVTTIEDVLREEIKQIQEDSQVRFKAYFELLCDIGYWKRVYNASANDRHEMALELEALKDTFATLRRVSRWIPIGERLPYTGDTVLVYVYDARNPDITFDIRKVMFDGDVFVHRLHAPDTFVFNVTHWMPLIAAPRGATND